MSIKRYWFEILCGLYGFLMAVGGAPFTTWPFWIGLAAILAAYVGVRVDSRD